jgi:hypothetical protein
MGRRRVTSEGDAEAEQTSSGWHHRLVLLKSPDPLLRNQCPE